MAQNRASLTDEQGQTPDWIELFNPNDFEIPLTGYGLSDDPARPFRWTFQSGTISPHGFLVVLADGKDQQPSSVPSIPPATLSGLRFWGRASAIDTNNLSVVRRVGGSVYVKRWEDLRGTATNPSAFIQNTTAFQPIWIPPNALTSAPAAMRFDGIDDALSLLQPTATNDFCLIFVIRNRAADEIDGASTGGTGGTSGQHYLFGANYGGASDAGAGISSGTNGLSVYEHGAGYMPAISVLRAGFGNIFQILAVQYSNRVARIYWQGNTSTPGTLSPRSHVVSPTTIGSGAYGAWNGDLAELLIYDNALAADDILALHHYLADQYSLPLRRFWHADFSLNHQGESVLLSRPDGTLQDRIDYPADIPTDVSYGRQQTTEGAWGWFTRPTPGASNNTRWSSEWLEPPRFLEPGGLSDHPFTLHLEVTNQATTIRYTLDGSEPDERSAIYQAGISLTNRTSTPNRYSLIPTIPGGIQPPDGLVTKLSVIRAKSFKAGQSPSATSTRSFLIAPPGSHRYSFPLVSLVSDPKNFFDPSIGIYVPGNAPGGNYAQAGDAWERPGHVEFFETNGTTAFDQDTGIRMHGNTSFYFPIKGLRLHPLNPPGLGPITYPIFPTLNISNFNRLLFRPSGHDYNLTLFRDVFMQSLGEELGLDVQASRPIVLFIDGEYWGVHHTQEAFEEGYFASHYPELKTAGVDYLEGFINAVEGDTQKWDEMMAYINTHDLSSSDAYHQLQHWMDVDNYIDFKACEIYFYRWDLGNHRPWRPKTENGRFRWILFDCDVGFGGFWAVPPAWNFPALLYEIEPNGPWTQYESNPGGNDHNSPIVTLLLRSLLKNSEFKNAFVNRFADLMNTTFQTNHVVSRIDAFARLLNPEMREHIARWHAPTSLTDWSNRVQALREFGIRRPAAMHQQLNQTFALGGQATIEIAVNDSSAGDIRINRTLIPLHSGSSWIGVYFKNIPIQVTAEPKIGYRFKRWVGMDATNSVLHLSLPLPGRLQAEFELDPSQNEGPPAPFRVADSSYVLSEWPSNSPPGTYPPNTLLWTSTDADPTLGSAYNQLWNLPYNLTNRSRILGLDALGISFLNTSESGGGGYGGTLVLGLDTRNTPQVQVRFTVGTVQPNSRPYAIRLQARVGTTGTFEDLRFSDGTLVEYLRDTTPGRALSIGPVNLPDLYLNRAYIQLRWVYYALGTGSGPRSELRLNNIEVATHLSPIPLSLQSTTLSSDKNLEIIFHTLPGIPLKIQMSTDLVNWTSIQETQASLEGLAHFSYPLQSSTPSLFFRFLPSSIP